LRQDLQAHPKSETSSRLPAPPPLFSASCALRQEGCQGDGPGRRLNETPI